MADIEFRVDAVLGEVTEVQNLIDKVNKGATLTIKNTQALNAVKAVQKQIDALKKSASGINLNFGGNNGGGNGQGGFANNNSNSKSVFANVDEAKAKMKELGAESANIISIEDKIASATFNIVDGFEKTRLKIKANGEEIENLGVKSEALQEKLKWVSGDLLTGDGNKITAMSDLANTDWFKTLGDNAEIIGGVTRSLNAQHEQIEKTTVRVKTSDDQWQKYKVTLNKTTGEMRILKGQTSDVINSQMNLSTMLKSAIERFAVWGVAMKVWTGVGNAINDCVTYVKDLNGAMTNIRVVTMDTKEATQDLLDTYNQMAQDLGANTTDIAEGATGWLRQGFDQADTAELVKDSTILSKLALIDNAQATEYLTSALKGYKLEAKDAMGVIDQLTAIDLEAATSAGDMAEAIK
jgi:hypothetical protein